MNQMNSRKQLQTLKGEGYALRCLLRTVRGSVLSCIAVFGFVCSPQVADPGGGTDFPNTRTITGTIVDSDHHIAAHAEVRLVAQTWLPAGAPAESCCVIDSTDSSGRYSITAPDTGIYNLQVVGGGRRQRLFVAAIEVEEQDDTVLIDEQQLENPGAVAVALPPSVAGQTGWVAFKGTTYLTEIDGNASVAIFDSVPVGMVASLYFVAVNAEEPVLLEDSVTVVKEDTVRITSHLGNAYVELLLNTTSEGADIEDDVVDFPLAVRLGALGVPLDGAGTGGTDLVVTRSDFRPLPFEVERWDTAAGEAVIWVLVDTIYGNRDRQSLFVFRGGSTMVSPEADQAVFDTANGFAAVWHLADRCVDATVNGHDGTSVGTVTDTAGIVGGAGGFRDSSHFTIEGLIDTAETVTLSAWAALGAPDDDGGEVVSLGDAVLIRMDDTWNDKGCQGSFYVDSLPEHDTLSHEYLASGQFLAGTGWHFFSYCVDRKTMTHRLFIDGALCCEAAMALPNLWSGVGASTIIGTHGNGKPFRNFNGVIDEVRVENRSRSAAWIKLCYMNQRSDTLLISVRN
ncbi:MAG: DUF2341 domain-containing protein [Chitinispirillaceae bacterium]|nr:DUF2341 domain-containing protein [Chitinispirillaceae bacterium]